MPASVLIYMVIKFFETFIFGFWFFVVLIFIILGSLLYLVNSCRRSLGYIGIPP